MRFAILFLAFLSAAPASAQTEYEIWPNGLFTISFPATWQAVGEGIFAPVDPPAGTTSYCAAQSQTPNDVLLDMRERDGLSDRADVFFANVAAQSLERQVAPDETFTVSARRPNRISRFGIEVRVEGSARTASGAQVAYDAHATYHLASWSLASIFCFTRRPVDAANPLAEEIEAILDTAVPSR